ncbi:hypothetical protein HNP99_003233 [Flavobacterium sp. 28A]|uniref:hypothetical protein n=1 Tax=Flavobacterium sp. 28A TaxID=2735895 RepID=UPI0015705B6F|nr:hypothetical protein [Flavobacterium sp. 28A]NRT16859.1 hypothetical protein [Flavobacterium sp. 28A]
MSQDKLFVIAIGGTGMRCLESFTHLCGIGMFDNQEIEVLTLDTDQTNGNKAKAEELIRLYNRVKTFGSNEGGTPNANTFFSAKLNLHRYWTNYAGTGRENYKNLSKISTGIPAQQQKNKLISDLFLDTDSVQEFDLAHGYRAQTHLGSMLMYHGIIEAARNIAKGVNVQPEEKDLNSFMSKLEQAGANARVFILGSVFGGTGASSIPVIPKALQEFIKIRSGGKSDIDFSKVKFGATLLTEYFTFKKPDNNQKSTKRDSVIADSSFFPLNSQAALQFYQGDPTVKKTYKTLYHIGWPIVSKKVDEEGKEKTETGGANQKNPCHITELLSACAAYDFFTRKKGMDDSTADAEYVYKAVEFKNNSFNFSFNDFVGNENKAGETFANRLGAFFSLAHISLTINKASTGDSGIRGFITRCDRQKLTQYNSISDDDCDDINNYFKQFAYTFENEKFIPGWLYQIRNTVAPGTFMFDSKAFPDTSNELKKLDVGTLFSDAKYHWPKGGIMSDRYDTFVKDQLIKQNYKEEQKVSTVKEKFMAHIYNAITESQAELTK